MKYRQTRYATSCQLPLCLIHCYEHVRAERLRINSERISLGIGIRVIRYNNDQKIYLYLYNKAYSNIKLTLIKDIKLAVL